jgi:hypothetical protein
MAFFFNASGPIQKSHILLTQMNEKFCTFFDGHGHNEHLFSIIMLNLLVLLFGRDVVLCPPAPAATATDLWSNYLRMFFRQMKFFRGNKRTQGVYH